MTDQEIYSGLIRLHILYQAARQPISGGWIRSELEKNGYYISKGTLYPILRRMSSQGYLALQNDHDNKNPIKLYRTTEKGERAFQESKSKIKELFSELFEDDNGS